jgi:hypothetical protein
MKGSRKKIEEQGRKKSENEKKDKGERTTGEKYYRKGGNIGREERFRERETLSPRRLKPERNEREEKHSLGVLHKLLELIIIILFPPP